MKRNVRFFSMILALLCIVSMIPMVTVTAAGTDSVEGLIDLSTYADGATYTAADGVTTYTVVKTLATLKANTTMSNNIILGADIDCTNESWSLINLNGHIFNGNGYAIYGIVVSSNTNLGLFSGVTGQNENVIKNLTVGLPGNEVQMSTSKINCGSGVLLGDINVTTEITYTFENVTVYANVSASSNVIGGFVGLIRMGTLNFTNCKFYGSVDNGNAGSNAAGGFVGEVGARKGKSTANFTNCVNYGTVTNGTSHTGGFVGKCVVSTGGSSVVIKDSVNVGNISGKMASGFIGYQKGASADVNATSAFDYCLNTGSIDGAQQAAGFIAYIDSADASVSLKNSVNVGPIHVSVGSEQWSSAAGFTFRYVRGSVVENCGSFGMVTSKGGDAKLAVSRLNSGWGGVTAKNLHYTEIEGAADLSTIEGYSDSVAMTREEGIAWANELLGEKLGKLVLNTNGTGAVLATPTFAGVQESNVEAGTIRLVATLNDSLNYSAVGFTVELVGGNTITKECNSVYRKLLSTNSQG
ncbi:MAG: hypothetical protein E7620_03000, partial [Ruminococcaceae bacterium]|nr:hypothetical protein [Oscillospiraceae bacterium]